MNRLHSAVAAAAVLLGLSGVVPAQYVFQFPGPVPAGNNAVNLYGGATSLTPAWASAANRWEVPVGPWHQV